MHVITEKCVNERTTFPEFINVYSLISSSGMLVIRTTNSDKLAKHLSIQTRAELRNK